MCSLQNEKRAAPAADRRRPRAVYGSGAEPDPRFTLANERTFLAWIRTSLALIASGVAVDAFITSLDSVTQRLVAATLVALGTACATSAFGRWMRTERALRHGRPLPGPRFAAVIGVVLGMLGVVVTVVVSTS